VVSAACRRARCPAWVCGGVGVVGVCGEVRRWADGVGAGGCVWGWACERRLWGGWALVPVFNLGMGGPLKVACSEVAIALGDAAAAATYLSAGFRLFGFDAGGGRVGGFSGGAGCGVGEDRAAGGFASRRGYAVTFTGASC